MLYHAAILLCFAFGMCGAMSQNRLTSRLASVERSIGKLKADVLDFRNNFKLIALALKLLTTVQRGLVEKTAVTPAAFSVGKTSSQHLKGQAVVTFDRVFLNAGNAFNLKTNTFTCKKPGIYAFFMHGLSGSNYRKFLTGIYHNNKLLVTAYVNVKESLSMGSNTVLLKLRINDTVQVKFVSGENELFGEKAAPDTTFSGIKIS